VDSDESGIDGVLLRVVEALQDPRAVVVVVTDAGELQAGEGGSSGVQASALLDRIVQARSEQAFNGVALTEALVEFAAGVAGGSEEGAERGVSGVDRQAVGVAGLIAVGIVGGGLLWLRTQRQVRRDAPLSETSSAAVGRCARRAGGRTAACADPPSPCSPCSACSCWHRPPPRRPP
jgi:hypothetical protein